MTHAGYSVSYRQHWWSRRLYSCGNVTLEEATRTASGLRRLGYNRVTVTNFERHTYYVQGLPQGER